MGVCPKCYGGNIDGEWGVESFCEFTCRDCGHVWIEKEDEETREALDSGAKVW